MKGCPICQDPRSTIMGTCLVCLKPIRPRLHKLQRDNILPQSTLSIKELDWLYRMGRQIDRDKNLCILWIHRDSMLPERETVVEDDYYGEDDEDEDAEGDWGRG